jgi:Subtilase family
MSLPSRPHARGLSRRSQRKFRFAGGQLLEPRQLLAPVVDHFLQVATFTPLPNQPNTQNLGNVTITQVATNDSSAPYTSVSLTAPAAAFGGDIVRIEAGPGGDFGQGVYAISRGAGDNASLGAINRPGVIYRLDPATGKSSVFFDLNTVINQLEPGGTAANSVSVASGLVNWYDLAFDPEGYFDGRPSLFVSSVDSHDPNKNVIYRIGPDGTFLGAFVSFTDTTGTLDFTNHPTAILLPPPEQQAFLRGLLSGGGTPSGGVGGLGGVFTALFFDANAFQPGQNINTAAFPPGVSGTAINFGPQTAFAVANNNYASPDYATFTDFGTPTIPGFPGQPGLSGIQGLGGDLLIKDAAGQVFIDPFAVTGPRAAIIATQPTATTPSGVDTSSAIGTPYRRFEDAAFDTYGYFSYGTSFTAGNAASVGAPTYAGSMFVADLAHGLAVSVTPPTAGALPIAIPVQGPGIAGIDSAGNLVFPPGSFGGRIIRIDQNGVVHPFASGFRTNNSYFSDSFINSSLSITFSGDGTTLYVADDDGVWQFKTVASLAGSSTGDLTGLNDLRTFGVPYNGQDSAVAIIDTGVDVLTPELRGRVSNGINVLTGGFGNDDNASAATGSGNGHGTPVAGVVAQFVPQATIDPISIFTPFQGSPGDTTAQTLYNGLDYLTKNPFVKDPVRPNKVDRVVAANMGFGTTATFDTEGVAYRKYPQIVISLKTELKKLRSLGVTPVAAAGQFGVPVGSGAAASTTVGDLNGMSLPAILNEVVSVTGSSPLPFSGSASTPPTDPPTGVYPRPLGPVLVFGANNGLTGTGTDVLGPAGVVTAGDVLVFANKILSSSNRNSTTDYAAPAFDLPTFGETFAGDLGANNVFTEGGTSLSSAVVTGSFAMTASALSYWSTLAESPGVTADAYLTVPVGMRTLNFGSNSLVDLSAYDNPDGINAILQWTAVPATDGINTVDTARPPHLIGSADFRQYSRVDVGNAIAAIEGVEAIKYLQDHNDFNIIDANHNGLITAQELQNFTDVAATIGLPEAGAMARLLGGTATIAAAGTTAFAETPDDPAALQRRFNFFDYAGDGQLNGAVSIQQLQMLGRMLLPAPDQFAIVDRQANAHTGYLLSPAASRDYANLGHIKPTYAWVPPSALKRFHNISPDRFHVDRNSPLPANPPFGLFTPKPAAKKTAAGAAKTTTTGAGNTPVAPTGTNQQTTKKTTGTSSPATTTTTNGTSSNLPAQSTPVVATPTNTPSQSNASSILAALQGLAGSAIGKPQAAGEIGPNLGTTTTPPTATQTPTTQAPGTTQSASTSSNTAATVPQTAATTATTHLTKAEKLQAAEAAHVAAVAKKKASLMSKLLKKKG